MNLGLLLSFILFQFIYLSTSDTTLQWKKLAKEISNTELNENDMQKNQEINLKIIEKHNNAPNPRKLENRAQFQMGPNHLIYLNHDQITSYYTANINISEVEYSSRFLKTKSHEDISNKDCTKNREKRSPVKPNIFTKKESSVKSNILPESVDWRRYTSPVTDQGGCGSCYAFAVAWAAESAYAIKNKVQYNVNQFSKQQLVDCTHFEYKDMNNIAYNNGGCLGGNVYRSFLYLLNNGLHLEADYPYISQRQTYVKNGKVQNCQFDSNKYSLKISNFYGVGYGIDQLKETLLKQPVVAYFYISEDFYFYKSGIFTTNKCGKNNCERVNHAVLIVGYGIEKGIEYWLCKNSWGDDWGENGYFRVEMRSNMCCVEAYNMYPYL